EETNRPRADKKTGWVPRGAGGPPAVQRFGDPPSPIRGRAGRATIRELWGFLKQRLGWPGRVQLRDERRKEAARHGVNHSHCWPNSLPSGPAPHLGRGGV